MDCWNEDAQSVYAEMDLAGATYEEGFKQLLTAIYNAGFLSEDVKIAVSSYTMEGSQNVMMGVELHLDENNIISSVTGHTSSSEEFGKSLELEGLDLYEGLTKLFNAMRQNDYLDENKFMHIDVDSEARKINLYKFIAQYEKENNFDIPLTNVYYANTGNVITGDKVTVSKEDRSWYVCTETYKNGVLRKKYVEGDGTYYKEEYDENGVITSYIGERTDGTYDEYQFDADGNIIESTDEYLDAE